MAYFKRGYGKNTEYQLAGKIKELMSNISDGSVSIIKQDSVVIQINTNQKILIRPHEIEVV